MNGDWSCDGDTLNSVCKIRCDEGYERNATLQIRTCQLDGTWSGPGDITKCLGKYLNLVLILV